MSNLENVCVQIANNGCPNCEMYFSKLPVICNQIVKIYLITFKSVFVQISKCICPNVQIDVIQIAKYICLNGQMYVSKFQNLFIQIAKWFRPNSTIVGIGSWESLRILDFF